MKLALVLLAVGVMTAMSPAQTSEDLATLAIQEADVCTVTCISLDDETADELTKQSLIKAAFIHGFTSEEDTKRFVKIGMDEAHKRRRILKEASQ